MILNDDMTNVKSCRFYWKACLSYEYIDVIGCNSNNVTQSRFNYSRYILTAICAVSSCSRVLISWKRTAAELKFRNKVCCWKSLQVFICDKMANNDCSKHERCRKGDRKYTIYMNTFLCCTDKNSEFKLRKDASHSAVFFLSGLSFGESARWRCRLLSSSYPFFIRLVTNWNMVWITNDTRWTGPGSPQGKDIHSFRQSFELLARVFRKRMCELVQNGAIRHCLSTNVHQGLLEVVCSLVMEYNHFPWSIWNI